ncbi:hypothetical protein K505DRAFT_330163 [Melanomma pulvis-pyrius CBS 109.77]|uniref:Uncharacterized protein n=1 Tax=Melanomma pulvis-pyrius CBS 109.77 TaxID=1314802 RepID=A0A6A6WS23_9PLEO|nr:hypothetical protein K505DRAFT_330163 [Melanomma pulvis-pyrius CBS 109.77]
MKDNLDPLVRQAKIDHAGIISKGSLQYSVFFLFGITIISVICRFRVRGTNRKQLAMADYLAILAVVSAIISTAILFYNLPKMYLLEAANRRHVLLTDSEIGPLLGLVNWTQTLIPMLWIAIFSIKFSFLFSFHGLISNPSIQVRSYFWGVAGFTIICWIFQSLYMAVACPHVDGEARSCACK